MARGKAQDNFRAKAPWIMTLLMRDFPIGLDDAVAIMGNLGHESAGLATLQETKPTVKGSKGGYGWGQWTASRRRNFMAWCTKNGLQPADDEANYRFLVFELRGSEKAAIPAVKKAKTLAAKVKAFELGFERAGTKHYPSRNQWAAVARDAWEANPTPALPAWSLPAGKAQDARPVLQAPKPVPAPPPAPAPLPAGRPAALIPIEVPGLEKSLAKSKTVWAALGGGALTVVATARDFIDSLTGLDWRVTITLIVVAAALLAFLIIHQRRKYRNAQRDIIDAVEAVDDHGLGTL